MTGFKLFSGDEDLRKAIDFILTSTEYSPYVNNPSAKDKYNKGVTQLAWLVERYMGFLKGRGRETPTGTPVEILKQTPYYKMADLTKVAASKDEFIKLAKDEFKDTSYAKAPVALLNLGGFNWDLKFKYEKSLTGTRKKKETKVQKEVKREPSSVIQELHEAFNLKIGQLEKKIKILTDRVDDLGELPSFNGLEAQVKKLREILSGPVVVKDDQLYSFAPMKELLKD